MDDKTSLDRLNDIALPPEVAAWPPAPGWWVLIAALLALGGFLVHKQWKVWRANAYRREALHDLAVAHDAASISEILRRCALAFTPRITIATKTGEAWVEWLDSKSPEKIPADLRNLLISGPYTQPPKHQVDELREFATRWIHDHKASGGSRT